MIQLAAYQGTSFISRAIRFQTRSVYSHIAVRFTEPLHVETNEHFGKRIKVCIEAGEVIEAWSYGVRKVPSLSDAHTPHTKVDLFEFVTPLTYAEEGHMAEFLCAQIGKPYDYQSIVRFLTREPESRSSKSKWFCSELAFESVLVAGRELLCNTPAWKVPPAWIPMSPLLKHAGSEWTV